MKKINVISDIYKNRSVNFNGFIIAFNADGKGIAEFEESKSEDFDKIFQMHPNIYKGDKLPIQKNSEEKAIESFISVNNSELDFFKESNKNLAMENSNLKKENANLIAENMSLKQENENLKQENINLKQEKEELESKLASTAMGDIRDELNKSTVAQLKELLNSEDFIEFKEEWKNLTKKEDIIDFIIKKVEK